MKASGQLLYGVPHGDVIHYDYTVTLPVMRHTVKALASTMEALGKPIRQRRMFTTSSIAGRSY